MFGPSVDSGSNINMGPGWNGMGGGNCMMTAIVMLIIFSLFRGGYGGLGEVKSGGCGGGVAMDSLMQFISGGFNNLSSQINTNNDNMQAAVNSVGSRLGDAICNMNMGVMNGFNGVNSAIQSTTNALGMGIMNAAAQTKDLLVAFNQNAMSAFCNQGNTLSTIQSQMVTKSELCSLANVIDRQFCATNANIQNGFATLKQDALASENARLREELCHARTQEGIRAMLIGSQANTFRNAQISLGSAGALTQVPTTSQNQVGGMGAF